MKITIVYDNDVYREGLRSGWGFAAVIETGKSPPILFDTGADISTLAHNMKELGIDLDGIGAIAISHAHVDHTGALSAVLEANQTAELFLSASYKRPLPGRKVATVSESMQLGEEVFSTGELGGVEQSLALRTRKGVVVLTGCAHPAMKSIFSAASRFGELYGIVGGFHGFCDLELFEGLSLICPCHCTQYKADILALYPGKALKCGAGRIIEI